MNRSLRLLPAVALAMLVAFLLTPVSLKADSKSARVVKVADNGDLHFSNGDKIRLMGVDLPSTWDCYGEERLDYMRKQLIGQMVSYSIEKNDLLGKPLAYVNAGGDVAADLIYSGYGFALLSFGYSNQDRYIRAQASAKEKKRGLWRACEVACDKRGCQTESSVLGCGK